MRLTLRFVAEPGEDDQDEDDVAEDIAECGAFGFMFVLGVLSFAEARRRIGESQLLRARVELSPGVIAASSSEMSLRRALY